MKVYVVLDHTYDGYYIIRIFSSKEKADKYVDDTNTHYKYDIEEMDVE